METSVLELLITGRYLARPAFGQLNKDIDTVTGKTNALQKTGAIVSGLGTAAIGAGVAWGIAMGTIIAKSQDWISNNLRIQNNLNATTSQMQLLDTKSKQWAFNFGQSSSDVLKNTYTVITALEGMGNTFDAIVNSSAIPSILALSKTTGTPGSPGYVDIGQTTKDVTRLVSGYNVPVGQIGGITGQLFWGEKQNVPLQSQILNAMLNAAPLHAAVGASFQDMLATVLEAGNVGALGIGGGGAGGTRLFSGLTQLLTTSTSAKALSGVGISRSDFFSATGQLKPIYQILQELRDHTKNMSANQRLAFEKGAFGQVGAKTLDALMQPSAIARMRQIESQMPSGGAAYFQLLKAAGSSVTPLQLLAAALQNLVNTIGPAASSILGQFVTKLANFIENITVMLDKLQAHNPKAFEKLITGLLTAPIGLIGSGIGLRMAGGILGALGGPTKVGGVMTTHGAELAKHLGGMIGGVFGAGQGAGRSLVGGLGASWRFLNRPEEEVGKDIGGFGWRMGAKHFPQATAANALGGGIGDFFGGLKGDVFGGIAEKVTGLIGKFKDLGGVIKLAAMGFPAFAAGALPIIAVVLAIAGIIAVVVLTFTKFRKEAETAGAAIGKGLTPIFQAFGAIFVTAVGAIQKAWASAWPQIQPAMQQLFKDLPKLTPILVAIGAVVGTVVAVIVAAIVGLVNGFLKALPFIIGFFDKVFSIVGDISQLVIAIFTGKWGRIPGILKNILSDAWGILSNAFGAIFHLVSGFVEGFIGFFKSLWDKLTKHSIIPEMVADILTILGTLPAKLLVLGGQIVQGLINGITGAAGKLKDNVLSLAGNVGGWFKNALGIHSPSTVFIELGKNTVQGYVLGIQQNQHAVAAAWAGMLGQGASTTTITNNTYGSQAMPYWMRFQNIQDRRMALQSGRLAVTEGNLLNRLDTQYRYGYQKTA